jgi:hypothetical protein
MMAVAGTVALSSHSSVSVRANLRQDAPPVVGEATSPTWVFVVHTLQDPYTGMVIRPVEPEPGTRHVDAEIEIRNDSNDPLNFASDLVRLRDIDAVEYGIGVVAGSEPLLPSLNKAPGDRLRGWVWYAVPEAAQLTGLVFYAPSPRLDIAVPEGD